VEVGKKIPGGGGILPGGGGNILVPGGGGDIPKDGGAKLAQTQKVVFMLFSCANRRFVSKVYYEEVYFCS